MSDTQADVEMKCKVCGALQSEQPDMNYSVGGRDRFGKATRWICAACNATKKKMWALNKQGHAFSITPEEREQFFAAAKGKNPAELLNLARTREAEKKTSSQTTTFNSGGKYYVEEDLRKMPRFASNEEALARLLERAPRLECEVTGETMYQLPEYSGSSSSSNSETRTSEQSAEGEGKIKPEKVDKGNDQVKRTNKEKPKLKISKTLARKIVKAETDIEQKLLHSAQLCLKSTNDIAKDYVPIGMLKKLEALDSDLQKRLDALREAYHAEEPDTDAVAKMLSDMTESIKQHLATTQKITGTRGPNATQRPALPRQPPARNISRKSVAHESASSTYVVLFFCRSLKVKIASFIFRGAVA